MDPEKKKRIERRVEKWERTDPVMRRLRERIEYYRAKTERRASS